MAHTTPIVRTSCWSDPRSSWYTGLWTGAGAIGPGCGMSPDDLGGAATRAGEGMGGGGACRVRRARAAWLLRCF